MFQRSFYMKILFHFLLFKFFSEGAMLKTRGVNERPKCSSFSFSKINGISCSCIFVYHDIFLFVFVHKNHEISCSCIIVCHEKCTIQIPDQKGFKLSNPIKAM